MLGDREAAPGALVELIGVVRQEQFGGGEVFGYRQERNLQVVEFTHEGEPTPTPMLLLCDHNRTCTVLSARCSSCSERCASRCAPAMEQSPVS